MKKYTQQALDRVFKELTNPAAQITDMDTENYILERLSTIKAFPKQWQNPKFLPGNNLLDTMQVLAFYFSDKEWNLKCVKYASIYEAWIGDVEFKVASNTPARAILAAIWNYHLSNDPKDTDEKKGA
jgi:hypothetical protein